MRIQTCIRFISLCSMTAIKCQDLCKLPLNQCFVKRYRNSEWRWTCSAPSLELCLFDLCPGSNLMQALGEPSSLAMHFSNNVKAEGKTFLAFTNHCRSSVLPCRTFPATEQRLYPVLLWHPKGILTNPWFESTKCPNRAFLKLHTSF